MKDLLLQYYDAFNRSSMEEFFSLLAEDVVHEINQGKQEVGKSAFRKFMEKMNECYREQAVDLVVFASEDKTRGAAEFFIEGEYLKTDAGLPPAKGQRYRLRCGAFFERKGNQICRITNYYNLNEWLSQIKGL